MKRILIVAIALLACTVASARIELPSLLGDGMVLQRNSEVSLWGKAAPQSRVTIRTSWNDCKKSITADLNGDWKTTVHTDEAGGPYFITISDGRNSKVSLKDVMLGEVWICGGQSNMEMPVKGFIGQPVNESEATIRECHAHPGIRIFNVKRHSTDTLQTDCKGEWMYPTPENVAECSATAYFFGRELSDILNVPVGIITSYWGGTMIETWMIEESILSIDGIDKSVFKEVPEGPGPGKLYNGMIHPVTRFTAKGFIWYQGESNRYHPFDYSKLMSSMIRLWRTSWGNDDMPFICAQLAQYRYDGAQYLCLPVLIEQQYKAARSTPNTYIAPTTDLDSPSIIHPARKRQCGERMAAIALKRCYGINGLPGESPEYSKMEIDGNKVTLHFTNMAESEDWPVNGESFSWLDKDLKVIKVKGFEIAGEDRRFFPAKASLSWPVADRIMVESDSVQVPVAVRYAFRNVIESNVTTVSGIPLAPFRTDDWEITPEMLRKD